MLRKVNNVKTTNFEVEKASLALMVSSDIMEIADLRSLRDCVDREAANGWIIEETLMKQEARAISRVMLEVEKVNLRLGVNVFNYDFNKNVVILKK